MSLTSFSHVTCHLPGSLEWQPQAWGDPQLSQRRETAEVNNRNSDGHQSLIIGNEVITTNTLHSELAQDCCPAAPPPRPARHLLPAARPLLLAVRRSPLHCAVPSPPHRGGDGLRVHEPSTEVRARVVATATKPYRCATTCARQTSFGVVYSEFIFNIPTRDPRGRGT